jgi:mannitol-1-phosphate 5-dehydrogenase
MTNATGRKKILIFGAGKIGRSFIGALFSRGGYEVIFTDKDERIIDVMNARHSYSITQKSEAGDEPITIERIRGIYSRNKDEVVCELASADICAVSVGLGAIPLIVPLLAEGLEERYRSRGLYPLNIIIAENVADGDKFLYMALRELLPEEFPLSDMVGLIETSIGKMVPLMLDQDLEEDPLTLYAEPYSTLILSKKGFKGPLPLIEGLEFKENIKAWVDRKLFIHNLGHVAVAYPAYLLNPSVKYVWEALKIPQIFKFARCVMLQAAAILQNRYFGEFPAGSLEIHIDELLYRFGNRVLGDTIYRVGCDLPRKLGAEDRVTGAIRMGRSERLHVDLMLFVLVCGSRFRATDEQGQMLPDDLLFVEEYMGNVRELIVEVCGFDRERDIDIIELAEEFEKQIEQGKIGEMLTFLIDC